MTRAALAGRKQQLPLSKCMLFFDISQKNQNPKSIIQIRLRTSSFQT